MDCASKYLLKLFVVGTSAKTAQAVANLTRICEAELPGNYELTVIDVQLTPDVAEREKILATPTLVKESPLPVRRIIGDLSDKDKLMAAMGRPSARH